MCLTLRAGGPDYRQCALDGQCGAVSLRAGRVNGAYASHARSLDARLHPSVRPGWGASMHQGVCTSIRNTMTYLLPQVLAIRG